MHEAIEALESAGLISEPDLLKIEDFQKNRVVKLYENVYSATHEAQLKVQEANSGEIDPFNFLASASMRAESTCWEWICRIQKLDFLGRYAALYADRITVPLPLRHPSKVEDVAWARSLLSHSGLTLLRLRPLIEAGLVVPVVMITQHCEHTQPWVDKMIEIAHGVANDAAAELAGKFRTVYQVPESSPTGRSTIYVEGPEDYLEHGRVVQLFDEGPGWRAKRWRFNKAGKIELKGQRKTAVLRRIFNQIATDTTFYLDYGRLHNARYLTDRRGEAFLLDMLTDDEELAASSAALNAFMNHSVPLLGDLSLATLLRIRREERDSFCRYRAALQRILNKVATQDRRMRKQEVHEVFQEQIQPELLRMKSELYQERRRQRRRIAGGLATLAASVGLGAFGGIVPLAAKLALAGAGAMVGGRLLSRAAEAKCEHGATLAEKNDFYFLLRLTQEAERN